MRRQSQNDGQRLTGRAAPPQLQTEQVSRRYSSCTSSRMLCEVLLSSLWFMFVIFWVETISVWLFLSMFYQDRAFYHWGDGVFADDPGQMIYMLSRVDTHMQTEMQT